MVGVRVAKDLARNGGDHRLLGVHRRHHQLAGHGGRHGLGHVLLEHLSMGARGRVRFQGKTSKKKTMGMHDNLRRKKAPMIIIMINDN